MALSGSRTKTAWCFTKKAVEKAAASDEVNRKEVAGDMAEKGFRRFQSFRNPKGKGKDKKGSGLPLSFATTSGQEQQGVTVQGSTASSGPDSADLSKGKKGGKSGKKGKKNKGKQGQAHATEQPAADPQQAQDQAAVGSTSWDTSWYGESGHGMDSAWSP